MPAALLAGAVAIVCSRAGMAEPPFLRLSLDEEPTSVDWNQTRSSVDRFILSFLMRGMMRTDPKGHPVCDLCESYSTSPDGRTYTFALKAGVEWSDGDKLTAGQFVDSFRRLLDPANDFPGAADFMKVDGAAPPAEGKWKPESLGVKALDARRLQVTLSEPAANFLELMTLPASYPVRKEFTAAAKKDQGISMAQSAVLGPYFLAAWEKRKRIVIEGNPSYKGSRPVYRVEFILGNKADMVKRFQAGKLDVLTDPTTDVLMQHRGLRVQVSPFWATRNLLMNTRHPQLADLGLRKAILLALDRETIASVARNGERPATSVIPPGLKGHRSSAWTSQDVSMAQAERHRALAWPKWVELTLLAQDSETDRKLAEWIQSRLEKIHVRVNIVTRGSKAYYERLESGRFDLAIHVWTFRTSSPFDLLETFQSGHPRNLTGWSSVAYDQIYAEALRERNPEQHEQKLASLLQVLEADSVGVIPLGYPAHPFLLRKRVTSFAITPFGDPDLVRIHINTARPGSGAAPNK